MKYDWIDEYLLANLTYLQKRALVRILKKNGTGEDI